MHILITGAAGFIGSHVADAALAAGHEVRGLDSLAPAVHDGRPGYWPADAELVIADVRDPPAVDAGTGRRRRGLPSGRDGRPRRQTWPTCPPTATST